MADSKSAQIAGLIEELSGPNRRRRQEVAHQIALTARANTKIVIPYIRSLTDALYRPEAQTRWEVLDALSSIAVGNPEAVVDALDGAEASLFDDSSSTVRLAAFVFLARMAASSPERSDQIWQLLDEAIQCYHGDAEYRDMLVALLELARGNASEATRKALAARVSFDAENGTGYIKTLSREILQALS